MKVLFRVSLFASLFGALIAGGTYASPQLSARLGLNLTEWLAAQQQIESERARSESLDQRRRIVRQSLETKLHAVEEMRAGRLTLHEAAAQFRSLSAPGTDRDRELFRLAYRGQSDEERWCRQVIGFVRGGSTDHPTLGSLADRLEAELTRGLAQGSVHVPR
jgi:hypothetical protein